LKIEVDNLNFNSEFKNSELKTGPNNSNIDEEFEFKTGVKKISFSPRGSECKGFNCETDVKQ